ncbi:MAG: hypothetical protein HZA20_11405 [Nitrospirae bacterium]|nr:hypothetical protein [Nitrospirota bacterium]
MSLRGFELENVDKFLFYTIVAIMIVLFLRLFWIDYKARCYAKEKYPDICSKHALALRGTGKGGPGTFDILKEITDPVFLGYRRAAIRNIIAIIVIGTTCFMIVVLYTKYRPYLSTLMFK